MDLMNLVRFLALMGVSLLVIAGILYIFARLDLPLGQLPGDITIKRDNFTCVFPLVTSLLLSIVLTLLLNLLVRFLNR